MLYEIETIRDWRFFSSHKIGADVPIDSDNTARNEIREGKRVFKPDFCIQKVPVTASYGADPSGGSEPQKLRQWRNRWNWLPDRSVAEPRHPLFPVDERGIEDNGAPRRQQDLQPDDVLKIKTKDLQPIPQLVSGDMAQSEDLMDTRAE